MAQKMIGYETLLISAAGGETDLTNMATKYTTTLPAPGGTLNPYDLAKFGSPYSDATMIELLCFATCNDDDDVEISFYGFAPGNTGPPEFIGEILFTFGTALKATGIRWADAAAVTDKHLETIKVEDENAERPCKVLFDALGYRYIYGIAHTITTGAATVITVLIRPIPTG